MAGIRLFSTKYMYNRMSFYGKIFGSWVNLLPPTPFPSSPKMHEGAIAINNYNTGKFIVFWVIKKIEDTIVLI